MIILIIVGIWFLGCFVYGFITGLTQPINTLENENITCDEYSEHDEEIAMLECIIERRQQASYILEKELEHTEDAKKQATLLNRINTLDKQTFKDRQRIEKLRGL